MDQKKSALKIVSHGCKEKGISVEALKGGRRVSQVSRVRHELAVRLSEELGLSFAEVARLLGVSLRPWPGLCRESC